LSQFDFIRIGELERILVESGVGTPEDVQRAAETNQGPVSTTAAA